MRGILIAVVFGLSACDGVDRSFTAGSNSVDAGSDLVGWWQFEEGSGETAADSSGSGNAAVISSGQWASGRNGIVLQMDGGNDSIVIIPMSESLGSTSENITVMAWTYRTTDQHNMAVVAHTYPALFFGFHGPQFKWLTSREPSWLRLAIRKFGPIRRTARGLGYPVDTNASCYVHPTDSSALNRWLHIAATYDGSMARLFVDGAEICSEPFSGSIGITNSPFTISGYLDESGQVKDGVIGRIDDVRIYSRALRDSEIQAEYSNSLKPARSSVERESR